MRRRALQAVAQLARTALDRPAQSSSSSSSSRRATRCFPRTRATSLVRSPAVGAAGGAVEAEGAGSAAGAGRGAGSGLAEGTAGSGSAAGTAADGTGAVTFGATAGVIAAVCIAGAAVLPGRTANSAQPHASPAVTAARPGNISRKFERNIGLSFSSRRRQSAQIRQVPSTPGCMAHRRSFASSTGNIGRDQSHRGSACCAVSPGRGMPMKQSPVKLGHRGRLTLNPHQCRLLVRHARRLRSLGVALSHCPR